MTTNSSSPAQRSPVVLVLDRCNDVAHTHTALAAHDPAAGRITLRPGPGTSRGRRVAMGARSHPPPPHAGTPSATARCRSMICSMRSTISLRPSPVKQLVNTRGRPSRTIRASRFITPRSERTCSARSTLLITSRSEVVTPGPRLRGDLVALCHVDDEVVGQHAAEREGEVVAPGLDEGDIPVGMLRQRIWRSPRVRRRAAADDCAQHPGGACPGASISACGSGIG